MKYFQIFNCNKEPFPGQPSAELFFPAAPYKSCLDHLLSAVQSGQQPFHAVVGDPGAGKTTIFFQFQKKLLAELNDVQIVSASATWFSSKNIFLGRLAETLGITQNGEQNDETLLQETKTVLSQSHQEGKKKIILLIDQAEKIPSYCLEVLEDLSSIKLNPDNLQFVLFGGSIFVNKISLYFNLSQNSNLIHLPKKLSFSDAKGLLSYYLTESGSALSLNSLVTTPGQYGLYHLSGGNPGRIIDLFRLTLTNQIIQDRAKAGWILCHQSAKEIFPDRVQRLGKIKMVSMAAVSILFLALIATTGQQQEPEQLSLAVPDEKNPPVAAPLKTPSVESPAPLDEVEIVEEKEQPEVSPQEHVADILKSLQEDGEKEKTASLAQQPLPVPEDPVENFPNEAPPAPKEIQGQPTFSKVQISKEQTNRNLPTVLPPNLGTITVSEEETLGDMIRRVYGPYSFTPGNTEKILSNNRHITSKHFLNVGDRITFPTMAVTLQEAAVSNAWIRLVTIEKLQDAYRYLRIYAQKDMPLLMIPSWREEETFQFNIVLEENFATQKEADSKLGQLSKEFFPTAVILDGLDRKFFYFSTQKTEVEKKADTVYRLPKEPKDQKVPVLSSNSKKVVQLATNTKQISRRTKNAATAIVEIKPGQQKTQNILGKLPMPKNSTLGHMIRAVYGKNSVNKANISWLLQRNSHIKDPNNIAPGTLVKFPAKAVYLPEDSAGAWWVNLGTFDTLLEACTFLLANTPAKPWLLIIPTRETPSRKFNVLVEKFFQNNDLAKEEAALLAADGFKGVTLIPGLDRTHYYFEEKSK